ncbi:MAG: bifunctional DNA-formamidopyrimidine glycosylase/DNA-(apurinic or apyrimidinic site) lyase [Planctomycetota bacterium]|jgi:formamidopyrimidine-DNA glycosylase
MPELPEAQTIAAQLDRCLRGVGLGRVVLRLGKIARCNGTTLRVALRGRSVRQVTRRGKRVVLELDPDATLVFRLGMTGQILVTDSTAPRDRHVHLRISLDDPGASGRELRYRDVRQFGSVWFTDGDDPPRPTSTSTASRAAGFSPRGAKTVEATPSPPGIDDLGPEPLEISPTEFDRLMSRRRQIKALLLDQRAIAGLGNIYCDEALFAARIHPLTRAADIDPPGRRALLRAIRRILRQAIRHGGSTLRDYRTATGQEGSFQTRHRVYGREGQPCPRCRTPIERIQSAGRSTHICPSCQQPATESCEPW